MWLYQIGPIIAARRRALYLTEQQLASLTSVPISDIHDLESGQLQDISYQTLCQIMAVVGLVLDLPTVQLRTRKRGLEMAAKNASVSYKNDIDPNTLCEILKTGTIPALYLSNIIHFLDEAPIPLVVMAAEEAAREMDRPESIWVNVRNLALSIDSERKNIWI